MKIIDTHCDVLYKLQVAKKKEGKLLNYRNADSIEANLERLQKGNVIVQFFAIFIDPSVPSEKVWRNTLEQIAIFHEEVVGKSDKIRHITKWDQIMELQEGEIGAVLTLEGAESFGRDLDKLHYLYREGIMSIGLTWNHANLCADGIGEKRGAGLTDLGKQVVTLNNKYKVFTDVSHLSIQAFWDVIESANYIIASHSNTKKICDHPRNLLDNQIESLFSHRGLIHIVFYPGFIKNESKHVTINDLIRHVDHLCALGGAKQIGFGSDFDGINQYVDGLSHAGMFPELINELLKHFTEEEVMGFAYKNFLRNLPGNENNR